MSNDEENLTDAFEATSELRKLVYQLKGEFISRMNSLDETLDYIVLVYFRHQLPAEEFRSWLLARIPTSGKIEVVVKILSRTGLGHLSRRYNQELQAANDYRNTLAHSAVGPALNKIAEGEGADSVIVRLLELTSIRASRSGVSATPIDLDELRNHLQRLDTVQSWTVFIMIAVSQHANGNDPLASFTRMEDANPEVPKLS